MKRKKISPFNEIKGTDNIILNIIGNMCGWVAYKFQNVQLKWGTMYEWPLDFLDFEENINKPEFSVDELW